MKKTLLILLTLLLVVTGCAANAPDTTSSRTEAAYDTAPAPAEEDAAGGAIVESPDDPEMMIERWEFHMETETFDEVFQSIQTLIEKHGAYVDAAEVSNQNLYAEQMHRHAHLLIRVEAEQTVSLLQGLRSSGHVVSEKLQKENVTERVRDSRVRLQMLRTKEERLTDLLGRAEDVEDLLTIENHLTETIAEKEQVMAQLNRLERDVKYQFVHVRLYEVSDLTPVESVQTGFGTRLRTAIRASFTGFVEFLQAAVLQIIYVLPLLLLLGIGLFVLARILRKKRPFEKIKQKKNDTKE